MKPETTFYGYSEDYAGETWTSSKFYNSIDKIILDASLEYGTIREYEFSQESKMPEVIKSYDVFTIEDYELYEYLQDSPEMNPDNYIVYSRSDDGMENMLTIVKGL